MDEMRRLKVLKAMSKMGTKNPRYNLNVVQLRKDGLCSVTDGCRLWQIQLPAPERMDADAVLLAPDVIQGLPQPLKYGNFEVSEVANQGGEKPPKVVFGCACQIITARTEKGRFPDTEKMHQSKGTDTTELAINVKSLKQIVALAVASGEQTIVMKVPCYSRSSVPEPIETTIGENVRGAFMPAIQK